MAVQQYINLEDYEKAAKGLLSQSTYGYYASGAWDMSTLRENQEAYKRLRIIYRVFKDVSKRSTECTLFGHKLSMPILIAPTAFHCLATPEGEVATAEAASTAGTLMSLSSLSTRTVEDVAKHAKGPLWFQLYINQDRGFTKALVQRVKKAGYSALVVTCDTPLWGKREPDVRNEFHLPPGISAVNLVRSEAEKELQYKGAGLGQAFKWMLDPSVTWKEISWLRECADLPVLVKGVCHADDALLAVKHGASGIIVSNHGGRQMDSAPATIERLEPIVQAVSGAVPVLVDGGIRRGTDVLKALALGATAVQIGRPILWGLAVAGANGAAHVLHLLREELDLAMALAGCSRIQDIRRDLVEWHHDSFR